MSTKSLARTVIEGGRYHYDKFDRQQATRVERAHARVIASQLADDPDAWEDSAPAPRRKVRRNFHDKLGPAERWLAKQCGRPWDKVYSEICARFDTRTLAGQHLVFDHLLMDVRRTTYPLRHRWHRFYVDEYGTLRQAKPRRYPWRRPEVPPIREEVSRWLGDRKVIARGRVVYWLEPTRPPRDGETPRFRQGRALNADDRAKLDTLNPTERAQFVVDADADAERA